MKACRSRASMRGMTLVEVLVSMTIFAFGVLGMLGMQARAISYFSDSKARTDAALLADALINDIWVDRANIANYNYTGSGTPPANEQSWVNEVKATLPNGNATVTVVGTQVTVVLTWQPPNEVNIGTHRHTEIATIQDP